LDQDDGETNSHEYAEEEQEQEHKQNYKQNTEEENCGCDKVVHFFLYKLNTVVFGHG
jgi:hypothetical protein